MDTRHHPSGALLQEARQTAGLSLQDLSARTKIRTDYLRALEDGNYSALPERAFARSYLQRYAAELNLDAAPLLSDFDRAVPQRPEIASALRGQVKRRGPALPLGLIAAAFSGLVVLGALGWGGYAMWNSRSGAQAQAPAATVALPSERQVHLSVTSKPAGARVYLDNRLLGQTPVNQFPLEARERGELRVELSGYQATRQTVALSQNQALAVQLQKQGTAPTGVKPKPLAGQQPPRDQVATGVSATPPATADTALARGTGVTLRFSGRSWVRVTDASGKVLYEGIPAVGTERQFPAGAKVRAGSAGMVQVVSPSGATPLGAPGTVVERSFP